MGHPLVNGSRTATLAVLAFFVAIAINVSPVNAEADPPSCQFKGYIQELEDLPADYYGDPAARVRAELTIRKKILTVIIDCAAEEARTLREKIEEVPAEGTSVATLRARFLETLQNAVQYYAEARSRVDTLGIGGSKDLAREIRTWRADTYTPTATQALNFLVWTKNQELFEAANGRLTDVKTAIKSLKLTDDETARALLEESVASLKEANDHNNRSRTELEQFPPPPDTLSTIQRSLEKLAHTYELFFKLSELAQKLIPLGGRQ